MSMLIVEGIIKNQLAALKRQAAGQEIVANSSQSNAITTSIETMIKHAMNVNFDKLRMLKSDQPYSEAHRIKLRTWQFLLVVLQFLDPAVYTPEFRQARVEAGNDDIILYMTAKLWEVSKLSHLPSIRQHIEVFAVKFCLRFPDVTLSDPKFFSTLLDPKLSKPQVVASFLMIVGFILTHEL